MIGGTLSIIAYVVLFLLFILVSKSLFTVLVRGGLGLDEVVIIWFDVECMYMYRSYGISQRCLTRRRLRLITVKTASSR